MILTGDCLQKINEIPDESIDLIITSPPYADARQKTYGGTSPDQYVDWFIKRSAGLFRVLKSSGSFILNIKERCEDGQRHTYVLRLILSLIEVQSWKWVEEYIWHKKTAAPGKWKYRFRDQWERCLHFTKTKDFKMHQDAVRIPIGDWKKTRLSNLSANDQNRQNSKTNSGIGRNISNWKNRELCYPSNVLTGAPVCHNTGHSAAFPLWLPEWFIKLFTDEGDKVLDPFVGSGTTLIAAKKLNRKGIGIEKKIEIAEQLRAKL